MSSKERKRCRTCGARWVFVRVGAEGDAEYGPSCEHDESYGDGEGEGEGVGEAANVNGETVEGVGEEDVPVPDGAPVRRRRRSAAEIAAAAESAAAEARAQRQRAPVETPLGRTQEEVRTLKVRVVQLEKRLGEMAEALTRKL